MQVQHFPNLLAQCNLFLFPKLKNPLKSKKFGDVEDIKRNNLEYPSSSILGYHQTLLVFHHMMGMVEQNATSLCCIHKFSVNVNNPNNEILIQ